MIRPPLLKPGDTVGIAAPGRKVSLSDMEKAGNILRSWGLNVIYGKHLFDDDHPYLSSTDEKRLDDFQTLLNHPDVKAILCARGGYGSSRIIDRLDFSTFRKNPKWIVGFSDITAIHLKLLRLGYMSIHGTMPLLFCRENAASSVESLKTLLFDGQCILHASSIPENKEGIAEGMVIGGNLSLINDSLSTSSEPDTRGKILIIEEIDEYLYRLDRMFTQLRRAGKLEFLSGLIIGHMTNISEGDTDFGESVKDIVLHAIRDYQYPVAFGFPTGHENPNLAWLHGCHAKLVVGKDEAVLSFNDSES